MLSIKVVAVSPANNSCLIVFFENGEVKVFDTKPLINKFDEFKALLNPDIFNLVKVEVGGYGISWNDDLDCSEGELYDNGIVIPLSIEDFILFSKYNVVNTAEACEILQCSRQNIGYLLKQNKLKPIKSYQKSKLFLKSDLEHKKI